MEKTQRTFWATQYHANVFMALQLHCAGGGMAVHTARAGEGGAGVHHSPGTRLPHWRKTAWARTQLFAVWVTVGNLFWASVPHL